ncbi:MAG: DUF1549 domain-containing protein, partial [Acidobacteriota bacterium]|nr:DUF1549 domain-containing protein [Acidobacteriota bacterium]
MGIGIYRGGLLFSALCACLVAQTPDPSFFETKIRPVLATKCYGCHSSTAKAPMGGLALNTKAGLAAGGSGGVVVVPGKPAESRLAKALTYADPHLQMPPSGKLPDSVIADFNQWIAGGAVDPRTDSISAGGTPSPLRGMSIEDGRKWWAFQPVSERPAPKVRNVRAVNNKVDAFIVFPLEKKHMKPSPRADRRTLVRRAYVDLAGYKPTYEEVEAFVLDKSPDAWAKLIDRLLASPQYGETWGRHWMDVARFGEDNPTSEATNPPFPFAWRYRDWIIEAMNKDVPYDRFVKLQLAADLMPGVPREDLRALGYLGAAPVYHKDLRLSGDVIGGFAADDYDERVDALGRSLLAMTIGCARCHDHKFDPIKTTDYYGLVGVFASTMRAERPLFEIDPKVESRYLWVQNRLFDLHYSAMLLTNEASTVVGSAERVAKWKAEIATLKTEMEGLQQQYPQLTKSVEKYWTFTPPRRPQPAAPGKDVAQVAKVPGDTKTGAGDAGPAAVPAAAPAAALAAQRPPRRALTSTEPFINGVYDAAQYVIADDPQFTFIVYRPGERRDFPVLLHGNAG